MKPRVLWLLIVVPMWLVCVWCTHFEPIVRDSWGHLHWHRDFPFTVDSLIQYAKGSYAHNNPRLGQLVTLLAFTPGPYHAIVTPLVEVLMFVLLAAHVLGRWPSIDRRDDALTFATVAAVVVACSPVIGQMLFYRPFTGNYLFGFVLDLALLLPYRFRLERARAGGWELVRAVLWLPLGFAAGMCNEHTGPAVGLFAVACAALVVQRDGVRAVRVWMVMGVIGLAAGWIVLMIAPGQDVRYDGVAKEAGTLERVLDRGVVLDAWLVVKPYLYLLVAIPWVVAGVVARVRAKRAGELSASTRCALQAYAITGLLMAITLLGSPKEGERLYFATVVLGAIAIAGWVLAQVRTPGAGVWPRRAVAAMSALALVFVAERCVETIYVVGQESRARVDSFATAAPGSVVEVRPYSRGLSRWFVGEDLDDVPRRRLIARDYGLGDIVLK